MDTEEGVKTIRGRGRGRGRGGRGRGGRGGRGGRARGKKHVKCVPVVEMEVEDGENVAPVAAPQQTEVAVDHAPKQIDLEADISQLEAPTFTTLNRGPPEPMLRLQWDHRVNLVAEKVLNPMIHCCDQCLKPILIYGRMIPCKHVFCLGCGKREDKVCPRCQEKVVRVEQTNLGTVFMCTHGGTRYNSAGCRRTYLSQRDLQAHINHRHVAGPSGGSGGSDTHLEQSSSVKIPTMSGGGGSGPRHKAAPPTNDPRGNDVHHRRVTSPPNAPPFVPHRPPLYQGRTNLITVPLQDTGMDTAPSSYQQHYPPPPAPPPQYAPPYGVPPPQPPPPQFYPNPQTGYAPPGPPQGPPPQYSSGPPTARPPHYQDPMGQPYPPPPQWPHPHPPPNNGQQFYR